MEKESEIQELPKWTKYLLSDGGCSKNHMKKLVELYTNGLSKLEKLKMISRFIDQVPDENNAIGILIDKSDDLILELLKETEGIGKEEADKIREEIQEILTSNVMLVSYSIRNIISSITQKISFTLNADNIFRDAKEITGEENFTGEEDRPI